MTAFDKLFVPADARPYLLEADDFIARISEDKRAQWTGRHDPVVDKIETFRWGKACELHAEYFLNVCGLPYFGPGVVREKGSLKEPDLWGVGSMRLPPIEVKSRKGGFLLWTIQANDPKFIVGACPDLLVLGYRYDPDKKLLGAELLFPVSAAIASLQPYTNFKTNRGDPGKRNICGKWILKQSPTVCITTIDALPG